MRIVLASSNPGKACEFKELLKNFDINLILQTDLGVTEIKETGLTFIENALIKARHAAYQTGLPTLADDSGLVVKALNGAPGIYSARFAGEHAKAEENIQKLLLELHPIPDAERQASFYCVLVFLTHALDPAPLVCAGQWAGRIIREAKGGQGFGYDPVFFVSTHNKTAAELPMEIKNKISHRAIALQQLLHALPEKI